MAFQFSFLLLAFLYDYVIVTRKSFLLRLGLKRRISHVPNLLQFSDNNSIESGTGEMRRLNRALKSTSVNVSMLLLLSLDYRPSLMKRWIALTTG